ncbi:FAD-binding monooxygenase ktnD-like [Bradysia coprophila]|uniref:FAD-binding monooxygenase ktnD-like n=1 Tax=Bradysia coprophila TaxID=38358 RepID=UPI00187DC926|nr:FAD-binding monooxygenase ktnD-like [Bradysia coprophila]
MARYEIGIIGAGVSGICAAIQLQKKFGSSLSFTIFEKNRDVGGTWFSNVYPGCACDVASHFYSFSFELNPNWSKNYPSQREILDYLKRLTGKYSISEHIKFQHEVKTICWNDELMKWMVRYVDGSVPNAGSEETRSFDIIINAPGALRIPLVPSEFDAFTGPKMHTAEWNKEIDLKNKKVAVIGSGASAVQIIPRIADSVETLHCYQRKPPYILPRPQFKFPNFVKAIFNWLPLVMWLYRFTFYVLHELLYGLFTPDSVLHTLGHKLTKTYRRRELKEHQHLLDDMTPKYSFGCKRVILSEEYYDAMARPNVHLHSNHIDKISERTIYTKDGSKEEVDVLILATGFRTNDYFSPMEVIGKGGKNVLRSWTDDRPRSYYGVAFSDTPNYFYLFGPNTVLGHSSVIFMIECQVNFIASAIAEMVKRNAKVINVKVSAEDEFMDRLDRNMKETIWGRESCGSWYANPRGDITILWSSTTSSYWWQMRNISWSKFDFL